jgi:hypothetical protein
MSLRAKGEAVSILELEIASGYAFEEIAIVEGR